MDSCSPRILLTQTLSALKPALKPTLKSTHLQAKAPWRSSKWLQSLLHLQKDEALVPPSFSNRYRGRGWGLTFCPRQQYDGDCCVDTCTHCHSRGHKEWNQCFIKNADTGDSTKCEWNSTAGSMLNGGMIILATPITSAFDICFLITPYLEFHDYLLHLTSVFALVWLSVSYDRQCVLILSLYG